MSTAFAEYLFDLPEAQGGPQEGSLEWMQLEIRKLKELNAKHGAMLTQAQVAIALGVTRGRVNQIVSAGRLPIKEIAGIKYIPADSLLPLMLAEPSKYNPVSKIKLALSAFQ